MFLFTHLIMATLTHFDAIDRYAQYYITSWVG